MFNQKEKNMMIIQWTLFLGMMLTAIFKQEQVFLARWAGLILIGFSIYLLLISYQAHANTNPVKLSSDPEPGENTQLVTCGIYAHIRHPIYLSFILLFWGLVLVTGYFSSLVVAVLATIFFYIKTQYEDRLLASKFPEFPNYKKDVGRFFPKQI